MLRFVILAHDWPTPHFDLLMQQGSSLRAWRLHADPTVDTSVVATANVDHRLAYLDYQGPISHDRGQVSQVDAGTFTGELGETFDVAWAGRVTGRATMTRAGDIYAFRIIAIDCPDRAH